MKLLVMDTATPTLVVGAVEAPDEPSQITPDAVLTVSSRIMTGVRHHNQKLVVLIDECMREAGWELGDLDGVVTGTGPGPFTGLRVGMATARGLALALSIPLFGVCSLDGIACSAARSGRGVVAIDARRRETYWAVYDGAVRRGEPQVCAPAEVIDRCGAQPTWVAAVPSIADKLGFEGVCDTAQATPKGLVGAARFDLRDAEVVPQYLRRPDAVPPRLGPASSALRFPDAAK